MTVAELIERLRQMPQDKPVIIEVDPYWRPVEDVLPPSMTVGTLLVTSVVIR